MEQFLMVAGAHFLALLSPGPDFFLIVRGALASGWRRASGVCVGVAAANGVYIALALSGTQALQAGSAAFIWLQAAGALYLAWVGVQLLRPRTRPHTGAAAPDVHAAPSAGLASWAQGLRMGLASGLLNPKNALFYAGLFAVVGNASPGLRMAYGAWMAGAVLAWDLSVAAAAGHPAVVARFLHQVPRIERVTGALLLALAAGVALNVALRP